VLADLRTLGVYGSGLTRFLRRQLTVAECHDLVRRELARRDSNFLQLAEHGIYGNPRSPYRRLLEHTGIELGDLRRLVRERGLEQSLDVLYDAGVHITHDELRGKRPVRRGSLEFEFAFEDTGNPLEQGVLAAQSGGSRGPGRVALVNFSSLEQQSAYYGVFLSAFGLLGRPAAVWYPPPPILSGLNTAVSHAKVGQPAERWFAQTPFSAQGEPRKAAILTAVAWAASRTARAPVPFPRHLPPERAHEVAGWAAAKREAGTPALVAATPSAAARVCRAAADAGLDVSGTFFRMGGEPFTSAKERLLTSVGALGACHYFTGEAGGLVGVACADPSAPGDVHVCADRIAIRGREVTLPSGASVSALCFTTIHPAMRTIALNLVTDDFGVLEERDCSCEFGRLGLRHHVHSIRSFEKLTGEGVSFLGEPLIALVEDVLPNRFGGDSTDYQFVERELDGVTRLQIRISPRLGVVPEADVVETTLAHLAAGDGGAGMMAQLWRTAGTVTVVREEPEATAASKVLPLHVAEPARSAQPPASSAQ
jgi:hypothetical protein